MATPLNDAEFHQQALAGGASRSSSTYEVPSRGYMVGGARNLSDQPFPEQQYAVDQFAVHHVRTHARAIRDHFGEDNSVHQGAWVEGDNVVLDASQNMGTYHEAISAAKDRQERAIYDVAREKDRYTKDARAVN